MNPAEYGRMYELEDHYWWFVGRRNVALRLLHRHVKTAAEKPRVLDVGCGTGVVSRDMQPWTQTVSLDMSPLALEFCQKRGLKNLVMGDGEALPIQHAALDGIIGLDIFEHIGDDELAFSEAYRSLRPGGVLVMSVPAFKSLWGPHDVALMHHRRYRRKDLGDKLRAAGFKVERMSYSVFFLFPVVVLVRLFEKRKKGPPKASLAALPKPINQMLIWLQTLEARIIQRMSLPWGSSLVAVARKPLAS